MVVDDAAGPVAGNTVRATFDEVPDQHCGVAVTAPGVWYQVTGTGARLGVGLCLGVADFDTRISVFEGGCGGLVCIGGNDDFCNLLSAYEWDSVTGQVYHVLVHGHNANTGQFGIVAVTV